MRASVVPTIGALVFPSSVATLQQKLFNDVVALDGDVARSTAPGLTASLRASWVSFVATFEAWYNLDPYTLSGYFTAGTLYDQGLQLETQLAAWQQTMLAAGVTLSEPIFAPPPPGVDWSALAAIAVSAAIVAGAFVVYPVVKEIVGVTTPRKKGRRR
jgi:hypothetical protein